MRKLFRVLALIPLSAPTFGCAAKKPPPHLPSVVVATPLVRRVSDWDDYVGQFEAVSTVQVRPRVSGYVQSVGFRDGQYVRKGQVLFTIDPRVYQAALDQAKGQQARAQAALQDAQVEFARARALMAAHATSQQDVDTRAATERQAEADLTAAKAAAASAQLNVGFTRVTAPIAGRVSDSRAQPGNLVNQDSTVLTTVVSTDPIRFAFQAPESLFLKQQRRTSGREEAAPVQIRLQDEADYRWNGQIAFVDNAIDTSSGAIRAYAVVPNPSRFLTPGMFGHMRMRSSQPREALLVPDQAVVTDLTRQILYVVDARGVVGQRQVQLGPLLDGLRVVRSGLEPTDEVVISGVQRAKPGARVAPSRGQIAPQAAALAQPDLGPPPGSATFAP
jgi:RND family efflux transporter MFP subunit